MEWLTKLQDLKQRFEDVWHKLLALKGSAWDMVARHPELRGDAEAAFAALRVAVATRGVAASLALVAAAEKVVSDAAAAYAGEAGAIKAMLDQLKALAN